MTSCTFAIHLLLLSIIFKLGSSSPIITLKQGSLRGQNLLTRKGRVFSSFTSIPYAAPPVGFLRFRAPKEANSWRGILNATKSHPLCPQINPFGETKDEVTGNEDCLYLNVYTPNLNERQKKLLPVMIYFHPGSFVLGDANYEAVNPKAMLDKEVLLVVPSYRLGPLGFLSMGDKILPGNNGLKDQNFAIKWVKRNINQFGGNPNKITLFGQSAGGASAHFHMLSPLSKHLINGVISESGVALSVWALSPGDQTQNHTKEFAKMFKCPIFSTKLMLACLRKINVNSLIKGQNAFYKWQGYPMTPFKVVVEPNIFGAFLPEHPIEVIKSDKAAKVPFITGITTQDGAMISPGIFGNKTLVEEFQWHFDEIAPISLQYQDTARNVDLVTNRIRKFYFDDNEITPSNDSRINATKMYTDGVFLTATNRILSLHKRYTKNPVYNYAFAYRGRLSYSALFGDPFHNYGVCHADELLYLFTADDLVSNYIPNDDDNQVTDLLITLWTNFAETGKPTLDLYEHKIIKWSPVATEALEYYVINTYENVRMAEGLYWDRYQFWKSLPICDYNCNSTQNVT